MKSKSTLNSNLEVIFLKIDRLSAWILLFSMLVFFITGYGMTKGIVNSAIATKMHLNLLPLIVMGSFVIHSFFAVRLAFKRWKIWSTFGKFLLPFIYLSLVIAFLYIHFFYNLGPNNFNNFLDNSSEQADEDSQSEKSGSENNVFSISELSKFDGQNGNPAYVAVDGIVYDMSNVFNDGFHYSHFAGQELSSEFFSYHSLGDIAKYPAVGTME